MEDAPTVTQLLRASRGGNREALDRLFSLLYAELRRVAHRQLLSQQRDATLNTTALIHEAYLRMVDQNQVDWEDRAHSSATRRAPCARSSWITHAAAAPESAAAG